MPRSIAFPSRPLARGRARSSPTGADERARRSAALGHLLRPGRAGQPWRSARTSESSRTMGIPEPRDDNGGSLTVIRRIDRAHPAVVCGLLAILMAAVFVPMSLFRLVDGDERSEEHTSE